MTVNVIKQLILLASFTHVFVTPASANAFESFPHSKARLVSSAESAAPGATITIALQVQLEKDWYSYWRNPADAGAAPLFFFELPPGVSVSEPIYPVPQRIESPPLVAFGYKQETMYLFEATLADSLPHGEPVNIGLSAEWLVCKVECIPAFGDFSLKIYIDELKKHSAFVQEISVYKSQVPVPFNDEDLVLAVAESDSVLLRLGAESIYQDIDFFPDTQVGLSYARPEIITTDANEIALNLRRGNVSSETDSELIRGILLLTIDDDHIEAFEVNTRLTDKLATSKLSRWRLLALAFVGGLLLNLMPCVFPVISIKLFGIVKHAHGRAGLVQMQCLAYVAGVVLSFMAIGGLLVALRMSGQALGWGFQLQSPVFLVILILLFAFLSFCFLGLVKISLTVGSLGSKLMSQDGLSGQFFTGILSTVVASPCTAPFMGVAMGAAITQSAMFILLTFAVLGLGLAAPYLIFVVYPRSLAWLPKPGAWMETLQQFLAFPLLATCIWLIWVLTQVAGSFVMASTLLAILFIGLGIWLHSRFQQSFTALTIALLAVGINVSLASRDSGANVAGSSVRHDGIDWKVFERTAVEDSLSQGRLVFVDFTADWCITCKVNERVTFTDATVRQFITTHDIVMYKADWTRRDPKITEALAEYGRIGVPMYLFRVPGTSEGFVLPEILTPAVFINEISRYAGLADL